MSTGQKIIDSLKEAAQGDFARVTVAGQTWVRLDRINTLDSCFREIVRDELMRCHVIKDCSDDV
jgi:hypothetical protein